MSVLDTLNQLRAGYGPTMTDDECVALINAAAWAHRAEGYGLSRKDAGTGGTRYDGVRLCHDVIMLQNGQAWDVLTGAGAQSTPTWGSVGVITDPSRGWVAPIAPQGTGTGTTPPPVVTPPVAGLTEDQVRAIVRAELLAVAAKFEALGQEMTAALAKLVQFAEQQEKRREELAVHLDQVIVERTKGWPIKASAKIIGSITGRIGE